MWDGIVSKEQCELYLKDVDKYAVGDQKTGDLNFRQGEVAASNGDAIVKEEIRNTDVRFIDPFSPLGCFIQAHLDLANKIAEWNFVVTSVEPLQIGKYTAGSHYDWHSDLSIPDANNITRKLSAILFLSDPKDYEGGELLFKDFELANKRPSQGSLIVFPSFFSHKVAPVTAGERFTAVCWATGPQFK
jgi:hypothetical protein